MKKKPRAQGRANIKFLLKLFSKSLQGVGQRPTTLPLPLVGGSLKKARETGAFGPAFPGRRRSCPLSHGCRRASSPRGGAKYVRRQKLAQSQVSPPPLGEVSCQRHDGEGSLPAARTQLPQGRRWENEHLIKKARFYAGPIRCSGEHLKGRYFLKVLM